MTCKGSHQLEWSSLATKTVAHRVLPVLPAITPGLSTGRRVAGTSDSWQRGDAEAGKVGRQYRWEALLLVVCLDSGTLSLCPHAGTGDNTHWRNTGLAPKPPYDLRSIAGMDITCVPTGTGTQWVHRHSTPRGSDAETEAAVALPWISAKQHGGNCT